MITATTLAARLDTLLGGELDRQIIADAVLEIIALDTDEMIVLPIAPRGHPADHCTVARIVPVGGVTPAFLSDPISYDYIRTRFNGLLFSKGNVR